MDVSEGYIKMCEKATGILNHYCKYEEGDFVYSPETKKVRNIFNIERITATEVRFVLSPQAEDWEADKSYHWLPRQDQLQEMVDVKGYANEDMIEVLLDWGGWIRSEADDNWKVFRQYETGEQLWLAFVMKREFGKVWNGRDWVKGDESV